MVNASEHDADKVFTAQLVKARQKKRARGYKKYSADLADQKSFFGFQQHPTPRYNYYNNVLFFDGIKTAAL